MNTSNTLISEQFVEAQSIFADLPPESLLALPHSEKELIDYAASLASLHEAQDRHNQGIHYTPASLAYSMVQQSTIAQAKEPISLYDPACGSGALLLAAFFQRRAIRGEEAFFEIHGNDIDPQAVALTKSLLFAASSLPKEKKIAHLTSAITCQDFLVSEATTKHDLIIANPPYVFDRGEKFSSSYEDLLRQRFAQVITGRMNLATLFFYHALQQVSPKGEVSMILPDSIATIDEAAWLRKRLITEQKLSALYVPQGLLFAQAGVEVIILTAANSDQSYQLRRDSTPTQTIPYPSDPSAPLLRSTLSPEIVSVLSKTKALDEACPWVSPKIAIQAYRLGGGSPPQTAEVVASHPFHLSEPTEETIPYLEGKAIGRFVHGAAESFLRYGPWLAEHQPIERFTKPRIAIREILGKPPTMIRAVLITEPLVYNRSVLHLISNGATLRQLKSLAALLNSPIMSFFLKTFGRKGARKLFPKLLMSDLKKLPIPERLGDYEEALSNLYGQLQDKPGDSVLEQELHAVSCSAFGCSVGLIDLEIESALLQTQRGVRGGLLA